MKATVIGAGLAGCEAAWQLARAGVEVRLVEMKPEVRSAAHCSDGMAELVCSNSLRGAGLSGAVGLLKEELRRAGSLLIACADATSVPAGRALAVDRDRFSSAVEARIRDNPRIEVVWQVAADLDFDVPVVVATGPMTEGALLEALVESGAALSYHDAIAPLVDASSVDMDRAFRADRYEGVGEEAAYLNCPFDEAEYLAFVRALVGAEKTPLKDFESAPFFEGCLPVEVMASRGEMTLAHGPMKPVGIVDPATGRRPFAVVQLRPENRARTAYNLVGFQTRLTRGEQRRVFRMIPGLEGASFERYGQVHRNTFVDAPAVLDERLALRSRPGVTLAGQITGVEGYVESIASGFLAGLYVSWALSGVRGSLPPATTALGGIARHTSRSPGGYQPSNVVWSMIETPPRQRREKKHVHRARCADGALVDLEAWLERCRRER